jgi:thiol:disulfide interchange protein
MNKTLRLIIGCALLQGAPTFAQESQTDTPAEQAKPSTYDESADATEQIAAAVAKAKKENRRVLLQWGANWCSWCHLLHGMMEKNPDVSRKLMYEYDVVLVDVGSDGVKNRDLARKYDATLASFPYLTILDSDGEVVVNSQTEPFEVSGDKPGHDPARLVEFLTKHQADYLSAESVLNEGLAEAKQNNKRVFLHFGAPWCGWCHKLEDWMAKKEIAKVLAKDYVDVKIDIDRTIGGKELLARYRKGQEDQGSIPWTVILDPDGKPVVNSTGPDGNIGFPVTEQEVAYFKTMLEKSTRNITGEDRAMLIKSLEKKESTEGG